MKKRLLSLLLAVLMIVSLLPTAAFAAVGDGDPVPAVALGDEASPAASSAEAEAPAALAEEVNLARLEGVTATADNWEEGDRQNGDHYNLNGAQAIDGVKSGDEHTNSGHWSTDAAIGTQRTLTVDLHRLCDLSSVKLFWKHDSVTAYTLATSADGQAWDTVYTFSGTRVSSAETGESITLSSNNTDIRYVRLQASADNQGEMSWAGVNLWEIEIYGTPGELINEELPDTPDGNLCRPATCDPADTVTTVTATASSQEANSVRAANAIDGNTASSSSRWGSSIGNGPHWIQIDLGTLRSVSLVKIFWERLNVLAYTLQGSADGSTWQTLHNCTSEITTVNETLSFDPVSIRYLKVNITSHKSTGLKGDGTESVDYNTVSLFEIEAYRDEQATPVTASSILSELGLTADSFEIVGGKLVLKSTVTDELPEGYSISFFVNLEQVVGPDGTVYTPLVDTAVELDVTVSNQEDPDDTASTPASTPIRFVIPGEHTANEGNDKPAVIPEIMEWYSSADQSSEAPFQLTENSHIIHRYGRDGGFDNVANELTDDLNDLFGLGMTTEKNHVHDKQTYADIAAAVQPGDIVIYNVLPNGTADNLGKTAGFDHETYRMEISDHVTIFATDATGAYWATRTLLQALKLSDTAGNGLTMDRGTIRDYPEFKVRGFILDVGRKPMSMDKLREIAKNMAWYKMNDFHVHLNDNLIFLEDYISGQWTDPTEYAKANNAYSAFRLESSIPEEPDAVAPLTAKDYHYTKAEYKKFVEDSAKIGVNIVSEIDVPAHAKAITDAFPSLRLFNANRMQNHPYNDHLNLTTKYDDSLSKVQQIFDEYIDSGVFGSSVHFGADEYYDSHPAYRRFVKDMIEYLNGKSNITTKRVWGSLTSMSNDQTQYPTSSIQAKGIQMNVWSAGWANPQDMYDLGFDLINCLDGNNYMVPYSGYYHPNGLGDAGYEWDPNNFGGTVIASGSSQMLGGAYAIWNDMIDTRANGVDEQDLFQKFFFEPLPYYACSLWSRSALNSAAMAKTQAVDSINVLSYAPNTNPTNEVDLADGAEQYASYDFATTADSSGNHHDLTLQGGAALQDGVLSLPATGNGYAQTGLDRLGWGNKLYFKVRKTANAGADTQILFEADAAYGDYAIKALPGSDDSHWKLGFSRELYDYEFPVDLPVGEWLELTLVNNQLNTVLYVNHGAPVSAVGKFVSNADSNTQFRGKTGITNSSFHFPIARIGSSKPGSSFVGLLNDLTISPLPEPVGNGKYDIPVDQYQAVTAGTAQSGSEADKAIDGDASTVWHTTWYVTCPTDKRWFQFELKEPTLIGGLNYLRSSGSNGAIQTFDIQVSSDGTDWTTVVTDGSFSGQIRWEAVAFPQVTTKYVRLIAKQTGGAQDNDLHIGQFISAAEIRLCTPRDMADVTVSLAAVVYPLTDGKAEPLPTVMFGDEILVKDVDYTVSYANNTQVSSASATASVIVTGKGAYSGQATASFRVTETPVISKTPLADATVTLAADSYPLENGVAQPDPVVKLGETTLLRGLDYTVTYANNDRVGTATVSVTGIGLYSGTKTATFQVAAPLTKKDLSNSRLTTVTLHQLTFVTSGEPITPEPVVVYNGETLVKDVDYTLSYVRNTTPGTATVTVTGIGLCTGSVSINFTIKDAATVKDLSDVTKTQIIFQPEEYAYTGRPIIPTFVVTYNGQRLVRDTDYTVELSNNVNGGNGVVVIRGMGDYYGPFVATFTITGGGTGGNTGGGSSGGSGGGTVSGPVTTTTEKRSDGASVTTKTDASGAMTSTATYPDGAKVTADIPVTGPITAVVTVPARADQVTVTIPTRGEPTPGQVAVILHADGTEEIIKTALANEAGLEVTLDASATIQVVDNAKTFVDIPANSWAKDAIVFVTSREIFNGTGSNTFSPNSDMSRAMVCTVLANLAGEDTKAGTTWYEKGLTWAKEQGISDTTAPHSIITREQLAVMLYRYAGSPVVSDEVPRRFRDRDSISIWAELAMTWAVQNDLIRGRSSLDGLDLAPQDTATRAEVASVLQRYVALLK